MEGIRERWAWTGLDSSPSHFLGFSPHFTVNNVNDKTTKYIWYYCNSGWVLFIIVSCTLGKKCLYFYPRAMDAVWREVPVVCIQSILPAAYMALLLTLFHSSLHAIIKRYIKSHAIIMNTVGLKSKETMCLMSGKAGRHTAEFCPNFWSSL